MIISVFSVVGRIDPKLLTTISTYSPDMSNHRLLFYWGSSSELVVISRGGPTSYDAMFPSTVPQAKKSDVIALIKEHAEKLSIIFEKHPNGEQLLFKAARTGQTSSLEQVTEESFLKMSPWKADQVFVLSDEKGLPVFPAYYIASPDWKDLVMLTSLTSGQYLTTPNKQDYWSVPGRRIVIAHAMIEGCRTTAKYIERAELYKLAVRQNFIRDDTPIGTNIAVSTAELDELAKRVLPLHPMYKKASSPTTENKRVTSERIPYTDLFEYGSISYAKSVLNPGETIEVDASGLEEQLRISVTLLLLDSEGVLHFHTSHPAAIEASRGMLEEMFMTDIKLHIVKES